MQEPGARRAIDHLMVARERESDAIDEFDIAIAPFRFELDGADTEDRDLRRVEERRERFDAEIAQIADGEGGAGQMIGGDGALDRLRADELIRVDREEVVEGRLRRYYRLTPAGTRRLAAEAARLQAAAAVALTRLNLAGGMAT